jgi:hypothetical protein
MPPGGEFHAVHGEGVGQPRHRSCGSPITALPWLESIRTPLRRRSATVSCRVSLQSAIRLSTSSNAMATDSVAALTSAMLTSGQRRDRTSRNAISGSTRGEQNRATKIENASRSLSVGCDSGHGSGRKPKRTPLGSGHKRETNSGGHRMRLRASPQFSSPRLDTEFAKSQGGGTAAAGGAWRRGKTGRQPCRNAVQHRFAIPKNAVPQWV